MSFTTNSCCHPVKITRLAPGDQQLALEYVVRADAEYAAAAAYVRPVDGNDWSVFPCEGTTAVIGPFWNRTDYIVRIVLTDADGTVIGRSRDRLFRCGFVPGIVVNYLHPEDDAFLSSGNCTCSPSICRAPDGALLVSMDIFKGGGGQDLTQIFRSEDNGETWHYASSLRPCYWGSLFTHRDKVYLLNTSTEYGALQLYGSADGGYTWCGPTVLIPGGSRAAGGPHKAPMPVTEYNGRLWSGVEYGSWQTRMHCPGVVSAPVDADLMDPASWSCTGFLPYDPEKVTGLVGTPVGGSIEGNVVPTPDGGLWDILRLQTGSCVPNYGKAYVVRVDADHPDKLPAFERLIDFPGNLSKFFIRRSPEDGMYYAFSNRVTLGDPAKKSSDAVNLAQRNVLTMLRSADLVHWEVRRDILNYADNCYGEDDKKVGFQYPSFIFDGEDILLAVRTAINNAENFHNANHITFHRVHGYAM